MFSDFSQNNPVLSVVQLVEMNVSKTITTFNGRFLSIEWVGLPQIFFKPAYTVLLNLHILHLLPLNVELKGYPVPVPTLIACEFVGYKFLKRNYLY